MPLKGYVCPPGGEEPGRQNDVAYCLSKCQRPCVTPPLLAAMWKADTENYHVGDYISASMIPDSGCARQTMLERQADYYDLPTKRYWPFRGTHAHKIVEDAGDIVGPYGWVQEIRMATELVYPEEPAPVFDADGVFTGTYDTTKPLTLYLRGTADAYNPYRGWLVDCKSMADRKVDMMIKGQKPGLYSKNLQDNWVEQLNIYRFLISRTPVSLEAREAFATHGLPQLKRKNYPAPTNLYIQGIAMMSHPVSGSQHAHKDRGRVTLYDIDPVPVWSLKDIEAFIRPRALDWYRTLNLGWVPPVVPASLSWLCKNCAFYDKKCFPEQERLENGRLSAEDPTSTAA
jgi:hypothetical protein